MTGDVPFNRGDGSAAGLPAGQRPMTYPTGPQPRSDAGRVVGLVAAVVAAVALVLSIAALSVALTSHTASTPSPPITTPTYPPAQTAAAQGQLCDAYRLGARAVQVDTNGHDVALGRVALTNAAAMLDNAANDPALDATHRDPARALAAAYRTATAKGSRDVATDAEFQTALDDINAKDAAMKKVCGGA